MRTLIYSIQTAFKSIWHEKWIYLLTVLSVSIGLLILSSFMAATLNVDSVLKRWSKSFGLVVYLDENLSRDEERTLENFFNQDADVLEVLYISKESAVKELSDSLQGRLLLPGQEGYDVARRVLNPTIDKHPALIVQPSGAADIMSAVTFARERELLVAVKCGGHSFSGNGMGLPESHATVHQIIGKIGGI